MTKGFGTFHLAQINIGRLRAPTDDPLVAEFMSALDEINALADSSPGFVWRFMTEDGNATAVRPFDDESLLINMSVWESLESLGDYVYRSDHAGYLRRRREWFERLKDVIVALWWVPAGSHPTVTEGVERLDYLRSSACGWLRRWAAPLCHQVTVSGQAGRSRSPRILVGQVGGPHRNISGPVVGAVAVPGHLSEAFPLPSWAIRITNAGQEDSWPLFSCRSFWRQRRATQEER